MRKICYLDCFSGISGDMLLGALLHAGVDFDILKAQLNNLGLGAFDFDHKTINDNGITAIKVVIDSTKRQDLRTLPHLLAILENSSLSENVCKKAETVFRTIAEAEAKVHGTDINKIHFHEIGALDTIVDVIGTLLSCEILGIDEIICSPLPQPRGFIDCAHGRVPLPAPATCEILQNTPSYGVELEQELVTPTGAALVKALANDFGMQPPMTQQLTGYGAGTQTLTNGQPNLLRVIIGEEAVVDERQQIEIIETNLDDWSPESFPYLCEKLFDQGALDVSLGSIIMKKGRPGFCLQVIANAETSHPLKQTILAETTAIGLRFRKENRLTLPRKAVTVTTPWGNIIAKQIQTAHGVVVYPEYEECKVIASRENIPLKQVCQAVLNYSETTKRP